MHESKVGVIKKTEKPKKLKKPKKKLTEKTKPKKRELTN